MLNDELLIHYNLIQPERKNKTKGHASLPFKTTKKKTTVFTHEIGELNDLL